MKICFFIASLRNSAGTERVTTVIANQLVNAGHDISIICWSGGRNSFFPLDAKINLRCLYEQSNINIYFKYLPSLVRYKKLLRKLDPDVVIDVCVPLSLLTIPATAFTRVKTISWEHFNVNVSWNNMLTAKYSRLLASRFAEKIVVLTKSDERAYVKRLNAKNVVIIPNPVTISVDRPSTLTSKTVLAVGRLTNQKGFDLLLHAWRKVMVNKSFLGVTKNWKLQIVGGGEDEQKLKSLCDELGLLKSVEFILPTTQMVRLYKGASIFAMSSRFEGLPLALIEAKAFGLPTIAFNCETGPQEVISHEVDGLLVEPEDIEAFSQAIIRMISNPEERLLFGKNSIAKAGMYNLNHIVESWNEVVKFDNSDKKSA